MNRGKGRQSSQLKGEKLKCTTHFKIVIILYAMLHYTRS